MNVFRKNRFGETEHTALLNGKSGVYSISAGPSEQLQTCRTPADSEPSSCPEEADDENSRLDMFKGVMVAMIGAGVMYGLSGVFIRLAANNGVEAVLILLLRSLIQSTIFGLAVKWKGGSFRPPTGKVKLMVAIAISYAVATASSYEAFAVIPPGSAIATRGATRTVFAIVFSFFIAGEKIRMKDYVTVLLCISGIGMIIAASVISRANDYRPPPGVANARMLANLYGYGMILLAGISRSLGMVLVRRTKGEIDVFVVVFYHSLLTVGIAAVVVGTRYPLQWPPNASGVGFAVGVCVVSTIATLSSNVAVRLTHPGLVALAQNSDLVVSITLQHLLLEIPPSALEITGAAVILAAVCGVAVARWRVNRSNAANGNECEMKPVVGAH